MSKRYIKRFESFQDLKRRFEKVNEAVVQFDDKYKVGGIEVSQSLINSYVKKVKTDANRNLRQLYSDMEIAELLVKYVADQKLDPDKIPATALLGGDPSMEDDIDMDSIQNSDVSDDSIQKEPEAASDDISEPTAGGESTEPPVEEQPMDNETSDMQESDEDSEQEENELPSSEENPGAEEFGEPTSEEESEETSEEEKEESEEGTEEEKTEEKEEGEEELPI